MIFFTGDSRSKFLDGIPRYAGTLSSGECSYFYKEGNGTRPIYEWCNEKDRYVIQSFTGLRDKDGKEIYEGDIIKFTYSVGDFAIMDMSKEDQKNQASIIGKKFVGTITPVLLTPNNLEIVVGDANSTHYVFPLIYASHGKIIGTIFEKTKVKKTVKTLKKG